MKVVVYDSVGNQAAIDELVAKEFSTGSRGFRGNFKATIDGKRYQANFNLVEIGSKSKK